MVELRPGTLPYNTLASSTFLFLSVFLPSICWSIETLLVHCVLFFFTFIPTCSSLSPTSHSALVSLVYSQFFQESVCHLATPPFGLSFSASFCQNVSFFLASTQTKPSLTFFCHLSLLFSYSFKMLKYISSSFPAPFHPLAL